jgi:uncharacterized protein
MASKFNISKSVFLAFFITMLFNGCFFSKPEFNLKNEDIQIQKCKEIENKQERIVCYDDISLDNSMASLKLGIFYADKKDYAKALEYLNSSKELGNYYANLPLAYLYFQGTGVEKNSQISLNLLKESASKDPNAAFQLSKFYLKGMGIKQDTAKGLEYLTSAANKNMFVAQKQLAMAYSQGLYDIKKDEEKAKYWQEKANNNKEDRTFDIYKL